MGYPKILAVAVVFFTGLIFTGVTVVDAQPEDRRRAPTASPNIDPCAGFGMARERTVSEPTAVDSRFPAPRGAATSASAGSRGRGMPGSLPAPAGAVAPTDPGYQDCYRGSR